MCLPLACAHTITDHSTKLVNTWIFFNDLAGVEYITKVLIGTNWLVCISLSYIKYEERGRFKKELIPYFIEILVPGAYGTGRRAFKCQEQDGNMYPVSDWFKIVSISPAVCNLKLPVTENATKCTFNYYSSTKWQP